MSDAVNVPAAPPPDLAAVRRAASGVESKIRSALGHAVHPAVVLKGIVK